MRRTWTAIVCLLIVSLSGLATAWETWHVDASVPTPGDGTSWPKAFNGIQHGIDAAKNGDIVLVAQGEYHENIRFKGKNISLTGMDRTKTVISGDSAGPTVTFLGTEDKSCSLSEFTINNGLAPNGGGIMGNGCRARIQNNDITSNVAEEFGGGLHDCDGLIQGNTIMGNQAKLHGGGLYVCDGIIQENAITDNVADLWGGGLAACYGLVQGNVIARNFADFCGGLIGCKGQIQNNSIITNFSNTNAGGLGFCDASIRGNLILGNTAHGQGGGLYRCHEHISCNTIVANWGDEGGGIYWCEGTVRNNIVWGNDANVGRQILYQTNPTYCCIEGWTAAGEGNIISAPGFVDPDGPDNDPSTFEDNDYRLMSRSTCIDQGYNEPWMLSGARDLNGNNRVFKGNLSATVDMGAYEFGSRVFQILEVKRAGGGTRLTWDSDLGESFAVWSCTSLPGAMQVIFWTKEATVSSQGSSTQWTDSSTRESTKFFRVELQ